MAKPYRDSRALFFETEAKNRSKARRPLVDENKSRLKAKELEKNRNNDVAEQLYAAAYLSLECIISYTKITEDFATRIWQVEPYSYRYRWLKAGGRWDPTILKKVFFGYDVEDDTIKMFMYGNIHDVTITPNSFTPQWEVEISQPEESWLELIGTDEPE